MELLLPKFGFIFWSFFTLSMVFIFLVALIDILRHQFKGSYTKLIWVLIVLLLPIVGSVLFLLIGRRERIKPVKTIIT